MKKATAILILLLWSAFAIANEIDTLSTKESVKKFLAANFTESTLHYYSRCGQISKTLKIPLYLSQPDTILVEDPESFEYIPKTIPRDSTSLLYWDTGTITLVRPYENIVYLIDEYPYTFHKADLDGNSYKDLIIDINSGIVIVVMDMRNTYEGYFLTDMIDFHSYSFLNFIQLPDNATGLLVRRNPSTMENNLYLMDLPRHITYITDTVRDHAGSSSVIKIDTLYKIISVIDSTKCCGCIDSVIVTTYSDTVDVRRYKVVDTLVYKFNSFVKYNSHYQPVGISKITYRNTHWNEHCACMEVQKNGFCFLAYANFDTCFSAMLESTNLDMLWNYMAYIDIKSEHSSGDYYSELYETNIFTIYFDDGTIKKINYADTSPARFSYLTEQLSTISRALPWQGSKNTNFKCLCQ
jgi:hypothetical protein